jgi:hypothetical protein
MADFTYPTSMELTEISRSLLPDLTQDDIIFKLLPIREVDSHILEWEQQDNYQGMQQFRGLNGDPPRVKALGAKKFLLQPGVYGEFMPVDESDLTVRRKFGTLNTPINIDDLVMQRAEQLLHRRIKRIKFIGWKLLTDGAFYINAPNGATAHVDIYKTQTYVAALSWVNANTSTPLQDLRNIQQMSLGYSINFGSNAIALMNRVTANYMLSNTNPADLGGKRTAGLSNILSMKQINELLTGEDLPNIQIYEGGYEDEAGVYNRFIPTGRIVIVGARSDGGRIGEYRMTRNANNATLGPGAYMKVVDNVNREVPRRIDVHDGHNGGPVLYYPSAIISMSV